LSLRYSSAVESKLNQDVKRIGKTVGGELLGYDYSIDTTAGFINSNGWFNAGRSYIKGLLCLLESRGHRGDKDLTI